MARFVIRPGTGIHGPEAAPRRPVDIHNSYRDAATVGAWLGNLSKAGSLISDAGLAIKQIHHGLGAEQTWPGYGPGGAPAAAQPAAPTAQPQSALVDPTETGGLLPVPGDTGQMPPGLLKSLAALEAEYPNKGEIYEAKKVAIMGAWSDVVQTLPRKHWQGAPQPVAPQVAQRASQAVAQPVMQQQPQRATAGGVAPIPVPQTAAADPREAAARNQALLAISGTQRPQMSIQQLQARANKIDMGSLAKIEQASFRAGVENSPEILYRALDMFEQFGKNAVFPSGWGTKHIDTARNKLFDRYIAGQKTGATGRKGSVANQFKLANFFRNYANDIGRGAARWDERIQRQYNTYMKAMRLQMERGKYPHALKTARITAQMRQAMYDGQLAYWKREFPGQAGARVEKLFTQRWKDFNNTLVKFRQATAKADMPQLTVIDLMRTGQLPDWAAAIRYVGSAMRTAGTETAKAMGYQTSLMDQLADANAINNSPEGNAVSRERLDTMAASMAAILSRKGKKVTGAQVLNAVRQQGGGVGFTPAQ